jgi:hypothetical protein
MMDWWIDGLVDLVDGAEKWGVERASSGVGAVVQVQNGECGVQNGLMEGAQECGVERAEFGSGEVVLL